MSSFEATLAGELAGIDQAGLRRALRRVESIEGGHLGYAGQSLVQFASNDYLGLASHPQVVEAAIEAARRYGAGSTASRLVCGSLAPHHELEELLAEWKKTEAALVFSSGFATALGVIPALLGNADIVVVDKLVHACCIDAARLSGATLRVYRHNDLEHLEEILVWANEQRSGKGATKRVLIVTESVFSMDGDQAPLEQIVDLKDRYGAWLMLDEAHAVGIHGETHSGLAEARGVADRVEVQMGTLSKALGASGGYIAGRRALVDYLVNSARSFIFSTAPVPAASVAAAAAIRVVRSPEGDEMVGRLWRNIGTLDRILEPHRGKQDRAASSILPWIVGPNQKALDLADGLRRRGIFVPAIRFPTVPHGKSRLRFSVSAAHSPADFELLEKALRELARETEPAPAA
ncbi:MAG TPA: 8-amino-7-oxononanoate synthase [Candidatus Limnocylindria bacterium]|nr:8-amino-7-oxononanoate synthase [Candidatus Limnocylindria bacterium]